MKRNKQSTRAMRKGSANPQDGDSKYARKKKSGRQMCGPGCCAHDRKGLLR